MLSEINIIDPRQSGISGDMLLSAVTDLFECHEMTNKMLNLITSKAAELFSIKSTYSVIKTTKNHIFGSFLEFKIFKDFESINVEQFKSNWEIILDSLNFSDKLKKLVFNILDIIISIEKEVHGKQNASLTEVHFHELNSIDTIIDITALAFILEQHDYPIFYGLPTALGNGRISFSHGNFQQPAPAVSKLLEYSQYPFISLESPIELVTPTGLANLVGLIQPKNFLNNFPSGQVIQTGIGLGQSQPNKFPNFLKIWKLKVFENQLEFRDSLVVLETNVDDVSGEILGNVIDSFSTLQGVKDVSIYPLLMKKNRPGHCIRILFDPKTINHEFLSTKLMEDTGTLGIRFYPVSRHETFREIVNHEFEFKSNGDTKITETIRIKVSKTSDGKIINIKPEFDDLNRVSKRYGIPTRILSNKILDSFNNNDLS